MSIVSRVPTKKQHLSEFSIGNAEWPSPSVSYSLRKCNGNSTKDVVRLQQQRKEEEDFVPLMHRGRHREKQRRTRTAEGGVGRIGYQPDDECTVGQRSHVVERHSIYNT